MIKASIQNIGIPYPIIIGSIRTELFGLLDQADYSKLFVLVDENTQEHCRPLISDVGKPGEVITIQIQAGELNKKLHTVEYIIEQLLAAGADRQSILINLGGGVIGDMGGFSAAIYMRGIRFIQIPTTLMSMVDASFGGKVGVDFKNFKNVIGSFSDPYAVLIDPIFLETLPDIEWLSGWAEMLKHALITDPALWKELTVLPNPKSAGNLSELIKKSVAIKSNYVRQDPTEKGIRKILNAGHTMGHALESYFLSIDEPIQHGIAVATGLRMESYFAAELGYLDKSIMEKIWTGLDQYYSVLPFKPEMLEHILHYIQRDKKMDRGEMRFVFLESIGSAKLNQVIGLETLIRLCNQYMQLTNPQP